MTLSGSVSDQPTKDKVKVASGNVQGVAAVNDDALDVDNPAPEATFYEVRSGDTLSAISLSQYGDANRYNVIFEANRPMLSSPDRIYPGQKLVIPPLS